MEKKDGREVGEEQAEETIRRAGLTLGDIFKGLVSILVALGSYCNSLKGRRYKICVLRIFDDRFVANGLKVGNGGNR